MNEAADPPVFTVSSGSPSPEELAAIVTVLTAAAAGAPAAGPTQDRPRVGGWRSYYRAVRREHRPGPGAWASR